MRRSQANTSGTTTKPDTSTSKKSSLELAYGSPGTKQNPSPKKGESPSDNKKSTPVVRKSRNQPVTVTQKPKQSTIVAASKASYAEKYGAITTRPPEIKPKERTMAASNSKSSSVRDANKKTVTTSRNAKAVTSSQKPIISNGSLQQQQKSKIVPQKAVKTPVKQVDEYEDDFEEDYQSDFEEVDSTDEEVVEPPVVKATAFLSDVENKSNELEVVSNSPKISPSPISEVDVSQSVEEFEVLEKQIENGLMSEENEEESDDNDENSPSISKASVNTHSLISNETQTSFPVQGFFSKSNNTNDKKEVPLNAGDGQFNSNQQNDINQKNNSKQEEHAYKGQNFNFKGDVVLSSSETQIVPVTKSLSKGAFDFVGSQKDADKKSRMDRSKKLKGMIRLNRVTVQLLHLEPAFEKFLFASTGTKRNHGSTQTDNQKSEESIQTDSIDNCTKWTQKPPTWSMTNASTDIRIVRQEAIGVGTDSLPINGNNNDDELLEKPVEVTNNWEQISKFISRASKKILYALESEKGLNLPYGNKTGSEIKLNRGLSILSKLNMSCLTCEGDFVACSNGHDSWSRWGVGPKSSNSKKHTSKNVITIWSLKEPSSPIYYLRAWGQVNVIHIYTLGHIVAAGNKDGSITVWDLDEQTDYHTQYQEQYIRTPSFLTSLMEPMHSVKIIGLSMFPEAKDTSMVISLDKSGKLIIWTCIRSKSLISDDNQSQYSSSWSKINLTVRHVIKLDDTDCDCLYVTDFLAWNDENIIEFAFSTLNGFTTRGVLNGDKTVFQKYIEEQNSGTAVTCFDICHSLNVLITGCGDNRCRFYDFGKTNKFISLLQCDSCPLYVQWSKRRSSLIYIAMAHSIAIWDLLISDMAPWKILKINNILDFTLYSSTQREFMVILSSNELTISSMAGDVQPLSQKEHTRIISYVALLISSS